MSVRTTADGRRRSVAWIYYAVLSVLALIVGVSSAGFAMVLGALLLAAYAVYLFRGGRFVLWVW